MLNKFSKRHPWLTGKIRLKFWILLNRIGIVSFTFPLADTELKIRINPKDDSVGKFAILGNYELETRIFASRFIIAGDQVVDIGANIGYFTLLFGSYVGEKGEVHSFEPSRREFVCLCDNVYLNHATNIFLNQLALGDQNGYTKMTVLDESQFGAYNSIGEVTHPHVSRAKTHIEIIRMIKLDDYLSLFPGLKPCVIKIDVEGYEKQVLEGMSTLISSEGAPCLILEVCESTVQGKHYSSLELVHYVETHGYKLYSPNRKGNLTPFRIGISQNCIALKPFHSQRLIDQGLEIALHS